MRIFEEGRSRGLSALALAAGLGGAAMALLALDELRVMLALSGAAGYRLSMLRSLVPAGMPPLAAFAVNYPAALFALAAAFWCSVTLLGFGLWRRREWARQAAVAGLYLLSAVFLLLLLFPGLAVPAPLYYGAAEISPEFNAVVRSAAFQLRLASLLAGSGCLWAALALDRGELRKEFTGPSLSN